MFYIVIYYIIIPYCILMLTFHVANIRHFQTLRKQAGGQGGGGGHGQQRAQRRRGSQRSLQRPTLRQKGGAARNVRYSGQHYGKKAARLAMFATAATAADNLQAFGGWRGRSIMPLATLTGHYLRSPAAPVRSPLLPLSLPCSPLPPFCLRVRRFRSPARHCRLFCLRVRRFRSPARHCRLCARCCPCPPPPPCPPACLLPAAARLCLAPPTTTPCGSLCAPRLPFGLRPLWPRHGAASPCARYACVTPQPRFGSANLITLTARSFMRRARPALATLALLARRILTRSHI